MLLRLEKIHFHEFFLAKFYFFNKYLQLINCYFQFLNLGKELISLVAEWDFWEKKENYV